MKYLIQGFVSFLFVGMIAGCAGDKSDIENADYILGKGGADNANTVLAMVTTTKIAAASGATKFELMRLYAGAKMQAAGFDGVKIIPILVYKDSDNTLQLIRDAVTLNTNSPQFLSDAIINLGAFIASKDFTASTDTRAKNGIIFQLGLANFFDAIRTSFKTSGISDTTGVLSQSDCEDRFNASTADVTNIGSSLDTAKTNFTDKATGSGLDVDNPLVKLLQSFRDQVPSTTSPTDIHNLCVYLVGQSQKAN
ncbi:MAG: hypothetical protein JWQ35_546 [Bacteriovoracaceae bacterium]|nr:hypothetical protein [Bacteriovoracaceae bacterium]